MERVNVGVVDDEVLNRETAAAPTGSDNQTLPKKSRTQSPSKEESGQSSNTRGGLLILTDPDLLNCSICTKPFRPPVYKCDNDHYACETCCKTISKCPTCLLPIGSVPCKAIEKVVESVSTSCDGCNEKVSYLEKQEHEKTCQFFPLMSCVNMQYGCNEKVSNLKKSEHETTCQYIPLPCPYSECKYIGEPRSLYKHYDEEHPHWGNLFTFNTIINLKFNVNVSTILLRERDENILFVVKRIIDTLGSFVAVRCLAPPTVSDMKFSYELKANKGENFISVTSTVDLEPDFAKRINKKKCQLIKNEFHSVMLHTLNFQLVIRKVS